MAPTQQVASLRGSQTSTSPCVTGRRARVGRTIPSFGSFADALAGGSGGRAAIRGCADDPALWATSRWGSRYTFWGGRNSSRWLVP
jgi:hypothetical protein